MKITLLSVSIRLTERDRDLLGLHADTLRTTPRLVKSVIRASLRQEPVCLPLPPVPIQPVCSKIIAVKFYEDEDEDLVEWLSYIQKQKRSVVIKGILRHAMECFDIRPYLIESAPPIKAAPRAETSSHRSYHYPIQNKSATSASFSEPPTPLPIKTEPSAMEPSVEEEAPADDWLSVFAELAGN